ncbi:MAG: hypothetical protein CME30_02500 [Gemmatimonadetes bacterium]|nr:hypothetical protein [Gemmatimonadota bacterium]
MSYGTRGIAKSRLGCLYELEVCKEATTIELTPVKSGLAFLIDTRPSEVRRKVDVGLESQSLSLSFNKQLACIIKTQGRGPE